MSRRPRARGVGAGPQPPASDDTVPPSAAAALQSYVTNPVNRTLMVATFGEEAQSLENVYLRLTETPELPKVAS